MSTPMPPRRSRKELREEAAQAEQAAAAAPQAQPAPEPVADSQPILVRSRRRRRAEEQGEFSAAPTADPQPQASEPLVAPAAPIRVSRRAHRLAEAQAELSSAASLVSATSSLSAPSGTSALSAPSAASVPEFAPPAVDFPAVRPDSYELPGIVSVPSAADWETAPQDSPAETQEPPAEPQVAPLWEDNSFPVTSFADFQQDTQPNALSQPSAPVSGWSTFASGEPATLESPQSFDSPSSFDAEDLGQPSWAAVAPAQVPGMLSDQSSPSAESAPGTGDPELGAADRAPTQTDTDEQAAAPQIGFGVLPDIPANPEVVNWGSMAGGISQDAPGESHAAAVALAAAERDPFDDTTDGDRSDLPTYSWLQLAILAGAAVILGIIVWLVLESRNNEESPESMPQDSISQTIDLENTSVIN